MKARTRTHLYASRIHKWLAIIVGVQLLLWFTSGALMSFLPIDRVHGDHLVDRKTIDALPAGTPLLNPASYLSGVAGPVESVTIHMQLGRPIAEVTTRSGTRLFDAASGITLGATDRQKAERIARAAWRGKGHPAVVIDRVLVESPEYRGPLPAWRVGFADGDATRVFVAEETGRITAVRTGTWRLYDFFWGLHIMDWKNHADFNTPWLLGFALGGFALWIGGAVLLYMRWPVRRRSVQRSVM